jgi:hypothetical protein
VTIDEALQQASREAARGVITLPADLHGFPGTAHGGAVAAVFHRLTLPRPPVELHVQLLRSVPISTPLVLSTGNEGATARLALTQGERRLAEATLRREGFARPDAAPLRAQWAANHDGAEEVPGTETCLACGSANPIGLGVRFLANERFLWRECLPPPAYRTRRGAHAALALVLLDELGWWLGALRQRECGVTTDVRITLLDSLPLAPLLVLGDRAEVMSEDDPRGRYCWATGVLFAPDGTILATSQVRFAGSRVYTRRLVEPFLTASPLDELARWFPSVRDLAPPKTAG